ncbi:hypothetical conserved protein [Oceanobacillus iheyensis HTE831]|uniref:Hypothetical conserved protein n=1 Tax=Oceanobacillus iheyensis (strain DSM 14371 / CIP 107618 / JCM 11309 / KCTC 3954 / HTE831) TaxID=221109 RepID=Q8ESN4_OCEIH|nr:DUF368 domain-containing protein [Oceanobacillus iheyensis]BAC12548.1 hypothetical conserved protein [Oceanobacillus iheyensis HTE831]
MEWKNIYRGLAMGATDVVPGISGGTIAVLLGIYDQLIQSLNGLFSKDWKKHLGFLIPLGIGIVAAIFLLASVIEWLFEHHPQQTQFFFLGLILGVLPYLFHKANAKTDFTAKHYVYLVIGFIVVSIMAFFNPTEGQAIENMTPATYLLLFVSGFIGSSAMIIPGISGSFMLLLLGVYTTVISAISNLYFDIIIVTGLGIAIGFIVMSKIIAYFLRNHYTSTYAVIIGLVIGAVVVVYPGFSDGVLGLIISVITFGLGLFVAYILGRVEYKQ